MSEYRERLATALRPWMYPEDGEGGHLYRERIATQQTNRALDDLMPVIDAIIAERPCRSHRHPHGRGYPRWLCRMGRSAPTPAASRWRRAVCLAQRIVWRVR